MSDTDPAAASSSHAAKDTHSRALAINLDGSIFGTFAEIGAGQEVARWFLTVGAASGTVAQTVSAYDKTYSDDLYGAGTRYVSRERLLAMLEREYALLRQRLGPSRGAQTRFFAFGDTVATRNFKGDNEQHGWVGLRFQAEPLAPTNDLLLHVNLLDSTAAEQQAALGVLGVNLLYAAHHAPRGSARAFLECLWDGLSIDRLEVDVLELTGPAFAGQSAGAWCVQLLRRQMARAILFDTDFRVVEPSSLLRKRPLLVDRGRFETVEPFHAAMLESAGRALRAEGGEGVALTREPQAVLELALHPVMDDDAPDDAAILARVRNMLGLGPALVSDLSEAFRLVPYLRRYTHEPIRLMGGVTQLVRILQAQFYEALPGSLLEGMGKLFASNVVYYVYPMPREAVVAALAAGGAASASAAAAKIGVPESSGKLIGPDDLTAPAPLHHLYRYLREAGRIVPIEPADGRPAPE
jgi:hypothetical protein